VRAIDTGTIMMIQRVGLSFRKPGSFHWPPLFFFFTIHDDVLDIANFRIICRMDQMSNEMFWTSMVQGDNSVSGLEDLNFPLTNET